MLDPRAQRIVDELGLAPHPEGGFYRETFRSPLMLRELVGRPESRFTGPRSASTAIYYLLPAGVFSAVHRVRSDEVWHHYDGDPLELHTFVEEGEGACEHAITRLGRDLGHGDRPQLVVPAGVWQAAVPVAPAVTGYTLAGCTVAPGFDFADFEMPARAELSARFPQHRAILERLTRR